ncbi:MAG: autotransporter outer membrane beta-barrel domain-containing protein [Sphingomonadales bacterium]|nr:autotransporter outer membrane beta-barrel domain-containing protein [Sphingomonadales bacterium]
MFDFSQSIGGNGGISGSGSTVTVNNEGAITIVGDGSFGIYAESVGGGGGKGNFSISNSLDAGPVASSVNTSVGGDGGASGHGGSVIVANNNDINTNGDYGSGIYASSTGGGGGHGGFSGAFSADFSLEASGDITTSVGGKGGAGGDGGAITVSNTDGSITTEKTGSAGINATSTGGGGGNGGWSAAGAIVITGGVPININVSVGGSGGAAGAGDDVTVTTSNTGINTGEITTNGSQADGIHAKSISDGGGNGGASYIGNLTTGSDLALGLSVSVGGEGGNGGASGTVTVNSGQDITTQGYESNGIFAASIGGGGGNGGASYIGSIVMPNPIEADVSVGGSGGDGAIGGDVSVNSTGNIETHGYKSIGISAESTGGGGGDGALSVIANVGVITPDAPTVSGLVSVGGTGGAGNVGGVVNVTSSGSIATHGTDSYGIKATSLGGGGGDGGLSAVLNIVASLPESEEPHANVNVSIGGTGGTGNVGGHVTVVQLGDDKTISTEAANSSGIYAQSIGGGGGTGGYSTAQTFPLKTPGLPDLSELDGISVTVGIGGDGGAGNHGGIVDLSNASNIETSGSFSHGVFGQSIGGGGGVAGKSGAGFVPYKTGADEDADETYENVSEGIFVGAETITGDFVELGQVSVFIGGKGGASGDGGEVNIHNSGYIHLGDTDTETSQSFGIMAQSIGGGGGIGGAATGGPFGNFDIGGKGGASGDGGNINVQNSGSITTHSAEGYGIFAQTVGGGGGLSLAKEVPGGSDADDGGEGEGEGEEPGSGGSATGAFGTEFALGIMVGGGGGGGGDGGNISLTNSGIITTHGEAAYGIIAQSIGGGGGIGKPLSVLVPTQIMGSNGDDGIGGDITITHTGSITTNGERAHGIFVQSASASIENNPVITITANGDVVANGEDASAIAVQNANVEADADADSLNAYAHRGAGSINVTVNSDVRVSGGERGEDSGADKAVGVLISGNAVSTITNHGSITTADGADGTAIWATAWNDRTVDNHGTITGSIILDSCEGSGFTTRETCWQQITDLGEIMFSSERNDLTYIVNNSDGARINSGSEFHLGYGGTFTNNGLLILGGGGKIITTDFTGHYVQSSTGRLIFEVDFAKDGQAGASDLINISWDASLAGTVQWAGFNNGNVTPGDHSVTFLTTAQDGGGGVHNNGLTLTNPASAILASSSLVFGDDSVGLNYTINFIPDGLTENQQTLGENISDIQAAGGLSTSSTMAAAAFTAHNVKDLGDVYSGISPEKHSKFSNLAIHASNKMSDAIHSCRQRDGEYRFIREGQCKWFRVSLQSLNNPSNTGINQLFQQKLEFAGGIQKEVGHNTHLGFGLSAVYGRQDIGDAITSTSDSLQFGVILKHRNKNTLFSMLANGGYSWHNTAREVVLDNQSLKANSSPNNGFLSMQARVAQNIDLGANWYITPSISTVATHVMNSGFTEAGAAGANLIIFASSETYISLRPTVELGAEFKGSSGDLWRPFISYGQSHIVDGQPVVTALFEGTPDGIAPFAVNGTFEKITKEMSLGIRYFNTKGAVFRVVAKRETTPNTRSIDVSLKVALPF